MIWLGDSDLVPKEFCDQVFPSNPTGQPWQAGCVQIEQLDTRSKGKLTVDELGNLVYTPDSAWHGADVFKIKLVTSTTRFNSTTPYMEVKVQVIQEHENRMQSDKINVSVVHGALTDSWLYWACWVYAVEKHKG